MKTAKKLIKLLVLTIALSLVPAAALTANAETEQQGILPSGISALETDKGWAYENGYRVYYSNGTKLKGWQQIGGERYYFNPSNGYAYANGLKQIGTEQYYFDAYGRAHRGLKKINNAYYYFNYNMRHGFVKIVNSYFYFNPDGRMQTGWRKINKYFYHFASTGKMLTGLQKINGSYYYFDSTGKMQTGLTKVNGSYYYFASSGKRQTGFVKIGSTFFYFKPEENGKMHTGWRKINGYFYYFTSSGKMVVGSQKINGYFYYFDSLGKMQTGLRKINGYYYYYNSSGKRQTGFIKISTSSFYFSPVNARMVTGWQTINGYQYYFLSSGKMVTSDFTSNGVTYRFNSSGHYLGSYRKVVRRALCVGEAEYFYSTADLEACEVDLYSMASMLSNSGYELVARKLNVNKATIREGIRQAFAKATENDISLFYFSGHGSTGGNIISSYSETITPAELASWLSEVPGQVIVLLDSCYSGGTINKSVSDDFNDAVIRAFAAKDNVTAKSGELSYSNKFTVLTASTQYTTSSAYRSHPTYNKPFSYFSLALVNGCGFNYFTGKKQTSAPADSNRDNQLTISECKSYINRCAVADNVKQRAQSYPENSSTVLIKR